jgi:hypothetical protein
MKKENDLKFFVQSDCNTQEGLTLYSHYEVIQRFSHENKDYLAIIDNKNKIQTLSVEFFVSKTK